MGPEDQQNNDGNQQDDQNSGNPAWKDILDVLPEDLHPLITPKLQEWDKTVQDQFQQRNSQFDPYRPLLDNQVPMENVEQALLMAYELQQNPEAFVERAVDAFNLDKFKAQQAPPGGSSDEYDEYEEDEDNPLAGLENHPAYQQLLQKAQEIEQWQRQQQEAQQDQEAEAMLDQYLKELHENNGEYREFNDLYVTAMLANGIDAEDAIKSYQETVKTDAQKFAESLAGQNNGGGNQGQPPVIMGGAGNAGSGVPDEPVNFGQLRKSELDLVVEQYLKNAAQSE